MFPELRGQAVALSEQLNDLVRVMTSIRTEGEKLRARRRRRLNDARVRLAGVQEEKRQSLSERQAELAQVRQAAPTYRRNVADLGELIAKLDKEVAGRDRARLLREGDRGRSARVAGTTASSGRQAAEPPPNKTAGTGHSDREPKPRSCWRQPATAWRC